ncbi:MAG: MBL fold metallo-hydrolase [Candidatus Binatia bacterium]
MIQYLCVVLLVLFAACEKPLKLPYIPPQLHNWPQPYKGVANLQLHVFTTGTFELPTTLVYSRGSLTNMVSLEMLVFVIAHPRHGLVLFGTGLNHEIAEEPERYMGTLRATLGTLTMEEGQNIVTQLEEANLPEGKIRTIILPDLRFDHAGELESFPDAQIIVTAAEHSAATDGNEQWAIEDEYDGVRNWKFVDFAGAKPVGTFAAHHDLFDDGSILLIDVAGATAGGLAALVRLPSGPVLLAGNLAWTKEQYFYVRPPRAVADREAWWEKAWRLKKFAELVPELLVIPDHDWSSVTPKNRTDIVFHPFPTKSEAKTNEKSGKKSGKRGP